MSVAGLRYQPKVWAHSSAPAETKSGSCIYIYIYEGSASGFHDWEFRTKVRVLQHRDRQRREVLKDLRAAASAKSQSASPCKWSSKWRGRSNRASSSHPTEGESSSDIPASPSNARRGKPTPEAEDEDVESLPSHPSQIESDEDDVPDTDPATYTLKDVKDEELDMSDCVQKVLEGLRGDAFCIASDIGLEASATQWHRPCG